MENMNPQEQQGYESTPQDTPENTLKEERSMGAILGSIIVVIILLVAAFYLWVNRPGETPLVEDTSANPTEILREEDVQTEALQTQNASDELDAIEADLGATDLGEGLTKELEEIDAELGL